MSKKIIKNGVKALQPEDYSRAIETRRSFQKMDRAFWQHSFVIITMTIVFSIMDALVLFSILDMAMTQAEYMGMVMALGIALVLNIIPLLTAKFLQQAIYKIKRFAGIWALVSVFAFLILFVGTVHLRFAYQDIYETSENTQLVNNISSEAPIQNVEDSQNSRNESFAIVLLLSVVPLVTSIVNFALAFLNDEELRKKVNALEIRRLELDEVISDAKAALATMDNDEKLLLNLDETNLICAKESVVAKGEILMATSRMLLAKYLADPSATSRLSAEMLDDKNVIGSNELYNNKENHFQHRLNVVD